MGIHIMPPLYVPVISGNQQPTITDTNTYAILHAEDNDYDTCHGKAVADDLYNNLKYCEVMHYKDVIAPPYHIARSVMFFDTSSLAGKTITYARLKLYCRAKTGSASWSLVVVPGTNVDDPPVAADYGDMRSNTTTLGAISNGDLTVDEYYYIELNSAGKAAINKAGDTILGFRVSKDISDIEPTTNNEATSWWMNAQGANVRPEFQIWTTQ